MTHGFENTDRDHASPAPPFCVVVVDYDTKRYAFEGPVTDLVPWEAEVDRIRRSGRDVSLFPTEIHMAKKATAEFRTAGFEEWPCRSIIDLAREASPTQRDVETTAPRGTNDVAGPLAGCRKSVSRDGPSSAPQLAAEQKEAKRRRRVNRAPGRTHNVG
jgi:hypothetical protein